MVWNRRIPIETRFWSKVNKTQSCWLWTAGCNDKGYGQFFLDGKHVYAHRYCYEIFKGKIPNGLELDHLCRNPKCVNPKHLEIVTQKENNYRGLSPTAINAKKTHCVNGHEFTIENTIIIRGTERRCRICTNRILREFRKRKKLVAL